MIADDCRLSTQDFSVSHITWALFTPRHPVALSAGFLGGAPWPELPENDRHLVQVRLFGVSLCKFGTGFWGWSCDI